VDYLGGKGNKLIMAKKLTEKVYYERTYIYKANLFV